MYVVELMHPPQTMDVSYCINKKHFFKVNKCENTRFYSLKQIHHKNIILWHRYYNILIRSEGAHSGLIWTPDLCATPLLRHSVNKGIAVVRSFFFFLYYVFSSHYNQSVIDICALFHGVHTAVVAWWDISRATASVHDLIPVDIGVKRLEVLLKQQGRLVRWSEMWPRWANNRTAEMSEGVWALASAQK